ncbi:STE/STE7 protein kinase [Spizellomyces punctatus DAOM BR117]|uniref:mitogen-activated protein kinase kinase n=1 Tax=Spizellomyces punctatus (strain DAOM BR117) TaxID=645134 RepID=A0A0L0HHW1_SPIPD|nr:STE/STE7 protein kinase [Spizellomyces punctatus DAOM BR117]KND00450.1 STE/STE7 protein kinase [Spizellomyces punctatus DAOM BR117]|eukprot:XP_016608489.1 STE/STE7 protein kinase [Spizellomyces punctatus DAOM BR117]
MNPPNLGGRRMHPKFKLAKPMTLSQLGTFSSPFANFAKYVDPSGRLNFHGKAILHASGVDFTNGNSYKINMNELMLLEELGKGQYGVVQKVHHVPTNVTMAMKEIRLELDQTKLNQILMELDVLHKSTSPFIVEFYGAFFIDCVYYCMEYMDAGSLDKLYGDGVPESVLAKMALAMVKGLKFLKDELSIIHRDVKPTNVLVNTKGDVKLCDFGVSGQLEQSLAKTNIGCQSYMAPERITTAEASTYTVQSDIWSLGLSLVELALGRYPYGGGKFDSVFAQLSAIVSGEPPELPADKFSQDCRDFVAKCLNKVPTERPTYGQLLDTPWLQKYETEKVDMAGWVQDALDAKNQRILLQQQMEQAQLAEQHPMA